MTVERISDGSIITGDHMNPKDVTTALADLVDYGARVVIENTDGIAAIKKWLRQRFDDLSLCRSDTVNLRIKRFDDPRNNDGVAYGLQTVTMSVKGAESIDSIRASQEFRDPDICIAAPYLLPDAPTTIVTFSVKEQTSMKIHVLSGRVRIEQSTRKKFGGAPKVVKPSDPPLKVVGPGSIKVLLKTCDPSVKNIGRHNMPTGSGVYVCEYTRAS